MITPFLEKLVLTGKAIAKTFTAGSQKNIIEVPQDHFIIITRFSHFPFCPIALNEPNPLAPNRLFVTQMRIFSESGGYSNFLIRNDITQGITFNATTGELATVWNTGSAYQEDCYLMHETDVSVSFSKTLNPPTILTAGIAPTTTAAKRPPTDYGKVGTPGSIQVGLTKAVGVGGIYRPLGKNTAIAAAPWNVSDLQFQIDATTRLQDAELQLSINSYPIVNFQYFIIKGRPSDILPAG